MSLQTHEPLTEKILSSLAAIEPFFSRSPGAAREIYGFNEPRRHHRMRQYQSEKERREKKRIQKALWNLERAQFIIQDNSAKQRYRMTSKGWLKFANAYARKVKKELKPNDRKKGKTYIIIFDIPEQHRQFRDTLRTILYTLGYHQLQRSVFAGDDAKAFEYVAKIVANCDLEDRVKLIIADKVL